MEQAINECNFDKGLGPDGFDGKLLKNPKIRANVKEFVARSINHSSFPEYLKEGRLVLFTKNGKDEAAVEETRPIVITSHLTKLIEKTLLVRLKKCDSALLKVGSYQTGFKNDRSTHMNLSKLLI